MSSTPFPVAAGGETTPARAGEAERTRGSRGPATPSPAELARGRWDSLQAPREARCLLLDAQAMAHAERYARNVENYIGTVKIPVGVAGPLRVEGAAAVGEFHLPLATTEAALVASYNRGARVITEAGGCKAMVLDEGLARSPGFAFGSLAQAASFVDWIRAEHATLQRIADSTTRHGRLIGVHPLVEGNHVYLDLVFTTGDAAGQNMATFAADAILRHVEHRSPFKPRYAFLEANTSGDKKASARAFLGVRGKRVSAEVTVPGVLIEQRLHTSVERIVDHWRMAALGGVLSGTIGAQGHYANGLAALYIACGQDAACVAESAVGVTRFERGEGEALYASVTLPALVVGTVGGGTKLPSQQACLRILDLPKAGASRAFAEICAALVLAGELSIIGALAAGEFARAHASLARGTGAV